MNNQTNKLIPELRFPEFVKNGEWEEKELGSISEIVRGGSPRPIQDYQTNDIDGLNWLKIADVSSESKYITETKEKVIKEALSSTREVNPGDLILSNSMSFGRPYILKIKTCIHDGWIAIRKISNKTFEDYLYYFISSESSQNYFQTNAAGAAVKNLNAEIIKLLPITFPNLKEQQKIASCLSSLDELLTAHTEKLEALKTHKKGLMQNLFPQEGEKVPKLRFKEFEKDGGWVITNVENNCLVKGRIGYRGYTTEDLVGQGEGALVLGGKHIQNQLLELKDPTYLSWKKYYESPEIMVEVGDIIFSQRGTLGDCAIINKEIGPATINPSMVLIKDITCDARFLYYILIGDSIQKEVQKNRSVGAIPMLSQKQIKDFPFLIPINPNEQKKIADTLSSLDNLIKEQVNKIELLKLHKKGLMQGLFPRAT
jgi:type I restriction enzyme S subunit